MPRTVSAVLIVICIVAGILLGTAYFRSSPDPSGPPTADCLVAACYLPVGTVIDDSQIEQSFKSVRIPVCMIPAEPVIDRTTLGGYTLIRTLRAGNAVEKGDFSYVPPTVAPRGYVKYILELISNKVFQIIPAGTPVSIIDGHGILLASKAKVLADLSGRRTQNRFAREIEVAVKPETVALLDIARETVELRLDFRDE